MGLKSGSRDAGLNGTDDEENRLTEREASRTDDHSERGTDVEDGTETAVDSTNPAATTEDVTEVSTEDTSPEDSSAETTDDSASAEPRPTMDSIPYKLRRNKVNEGREQVPYFLRDEIIDAEDGLQNTLEELLGEDVYKSDYREAAMIVAQRNPELVADVLREWGYDLDAT